METETILEDCAKQIITEFLTEDDEFLSRVYLRLYPQTTPLSPNEIRSHLNALPTKEILQATFFNPSWLYGDGFAFLHRNDTAVPADSYHNLIAMWTKACIHALGMADDPFIGRLLPPGRARRFTSIPFVEICFGNGIRAAGGPTAERMKFMSSSYKSAFARIQQNGLISSQQLVVVGGGFDAGSLRDNVPSGTKSFELDLPSVVECKHRMLERYALEFPSEVDRVATLAQIDLLQSVPSDVLQPLQVPDWSPTLPTIFVIEAVLSYLPSERRDAVLRDIVGLMKQCTNAELILWD
jgi:hypothetical protein